VVRLSPASKAGERFRTNDFTYCSNARFIGPCGLAAPGALWPVLMSETHGNVKLRLVKRSDCGLTDP
jgi:hypothetical protein